MYRCTFKDCNKIYVKQSRYNEHIRTHTGERPFSCNLCGASFARKDKLTSHIRHTHTDIRPHVCVIEGCTKSFVSCSHLNRHIKCVHDKKYKCDSCIASFSKNYQLKKHIAGHLAMRYTATRQSSILSTAATVSINQERGKHNAPQMREITLQTDIDCTQIDINTDTHTHTHTHTHIHTHIPSRNNLDSHKSSEEIPTHTDTHTHTNIHTDTHTRSY
eukprot:GHVR01076271.1.p1 GENE.GHVR01076271.1~~GHVR01076271.1.p1  ORF type:complete len:217 (+),score=98.74 GHVR01076271.1:72-722(+)